MPTPATLVLGAGAPEILRIPGAVHVDIYPFPDCQRVDLNIMPWPFETDQFDKIIAHDVIEHCDSVVGFVEECHRILAPGGTVEIRTAFWEARQSYTDPTHKHWFTEDSMDFFVPDTFWSQKYWWYSKARFQKVFCKRTTESEIMWILKPVKEKI